MKTDIAEGNYIMKTRVFSARGTYTFAVIVVIVIFVCWNHEVY